MDAFLIRQLFKGMVCWVGTPLNPEEDQALTKKLEANGGTLKRIERGAVLYDSLGPDDGSTAAVTAGATTMTRKMQADQEPPIVLVDQRRADVTAFVEMLPRNFHPKARAVDFHWILKSCEGNKRLPMEPFVVHPLSTKSNVATSVKRQAPIVPDGHVTSSCHLSNSQPLQKKHKSDTGLLTSSSDSTDLPPLVTAAPAGEWTWRAIHQEALWVLDTLGATMRRSLALKLQQPESKTAIAAFDLDNTLIATKSEKRFAQSASDWKWLDPSVPRRLEQLAQEGFELVIISNQNGISKGNVSADEVKQRVEQMALKAKVPLLVLLATQNDLMRKPRVGAWHEALAWLGVSGPNQVDMSKSFYCGDAAGRPKDGKRKKDFSASDYKFALNLGLSFVTPEAFFLNSKQRLHCREEIRELGFDPRTEISCSPPAHPFKRLKRQEMIVLVGPPASGKSTLCSTLLADHTRINQDELKSLAKCRTVCTDALLRHESVVIDSTNRDQRIRSEWIGIAKRQQLPVRCIELTVSKDLSMHLNVFRMLTSADTRRVPDIAIHSFFKSFQPPQEAEGFDEVVRLPFAVNAASLPLPDRQLQLLRSFLI